jgi:hypothetical protein
MIPIRLSLAPLALLSLVFKSANNSHQGSWWKKSTRVFVFDSRSSQQLIGGQAFRPVKRYNHKGRMIEFNWVRAVVIHA